VVEASPPVRPVLRGLRAADRFAALPEVDLARWSDAEPDTTGAAGADWGEGAELNVDAEWTVFEPPVVVTGEDVCAAP